MSIFRFKEFTINQDLAPFKVGTDGVLLGSLCSKIKANRVLEIGTGTGLIALMIAQNNDGLVDAIEINEEAYKIAQYNINQSNWASRINCTRIALQQFVMGNSNKYDLIVCNPPFFENSKRSKNESKNVARHTHCLTTNDLISCSQKILNPTGKIIVIYPYTQMDHIINTADKWSLHCSAKWNVKPTPYKPPKRIILQFEKTKKKLQETTIVIEQNGRHQYSEEYIRLTEPYYL